jgi:hypothetical protein
MAKYLAAITVLAFAALGGSLRAQLDDSCTVSAFNRTAPVQADGVWVLPDVPANLGPVRVRATCVENGTVRSGQSGLITIPANGAVKADIDFASPVAIPARLELSASAVLLNAVGQTVQLTAQATYPNGSSADLTAADQGTNYRTSNPAIATVDTGGLVTAKASGVALVSAVNEGTLGILRIQVVASGDSDGDGLPDDWELAHGLDPNNPVDALADPDGDGLSTIDEYRLGTDPFASDTDGDRLSDGAEGAFGTNPLLFDTDGDRVSDGLEVMAGSDPRDPESANLAPILQSLTVRPSSFMITFNTVSSEASRRLDVVARLVDGTEIDARSLRYGTRYASNDLTVASFGAEAGRVFAGRDGIATVTVSLGSASATTQVRVETFSPTALSFLPIPGFANGVDVDGTHAYVAAGEAGLVVVDVADLTSPWIAGSVDTPGNADDVRAGDGFAYVADGAAGLQIVDIQDPEHPLIAGSVDTPGEATDLVVLGNLVLVADGPVGLQVIDVTNRSAPFLLGGVDTPGRARGIDAAGGLAVVADGTGGVHVIDISDPTRPAILGSTHTRPDGTSRAADVVVRGRLAFVSDGADFLLGGLKVVDFRVPSTPVVVGSTSGGFGLTSVTADGGFVLAADYLFINAVPVFEAAASLGFRGLLDFAPTSYRDDEGNGIAARDGVVFLAGNRVFLRDNGIEASSALHIGRYRVMEDDLGVAPTVAWVDPPASALERTTLTLRAEASDDVGIAAVEFLVDGVLQLRDVTAPYETTVTVPVGRPELRLTARAVDFGSNEALAETTIAIIPDDHPRIALLAPSPGVVLSEGAAMTVAVEASDDVAVASVEIKIDGVTRHTASAPPYGFQYTLPLGTRQVAVEAVVKDGAGQSATTGPVTFPVVADGPPFVALLSPTELTEVMRGEVVHVLVAAADDIGVAQVRLLFNGQPGVQDTQVPYEFDVTVPAAASDIRLSAQAVDTLGQTATAQEVVLHVTGGSSTAVAGTVVDTGGRPLAGAAVTCLGVSGSTGADGAFTVGGVPVLLGDVRCTASLTLPAGATLAGQSAAVPPVAGGTTGVGTIVAAPLTPFLFAAPSLTAVNGLPSGTLWVKVADLNLDGLADLVAASGSSNEVSVWLNRVDGTYAAMPRIRVGQQPAGVALADLDSNGFPDVITANTQSGDVSVLLGKGDGTFLAPQSFAAGSGPSAVAAGDLDGDGIADVVTANRLSNDLSVLPGRLDGSLGAGTRLAAGTSPSAVAVVDLSQDGILDIVAANQTSNSVTVYRGNGDGTFTSEPGAPTGDGPRALLILDLDADGKPEVVTAGINSLSILVRGASGAGFDSEIRITVSALGVVASGDLDRDGRPDLITADAVLLNRGGLTFQSAAGPGIVQTGSLAVADLNRDGAADVVAGRPAAAVLMFGRGDGSLQGPRGLDAGITPRTVAVTDVNLDGVLDLITANEISNALGVRLGQGGGTFQPLSLVPACAAPVSASTGDGVPDVVASCFTFSQIASLLGTGNGTFTVRGRYDGGFHAISEVLADFNGDGMLDVATVGDTFITTFLGNGDGSFQPRSVVSPGSSADYSDVTAGDVDGNGTQDLIAAARGRTYVSLLKGRGDGTFLTEVRLTVGSRPASAVLADLNGDGALDLVTANMGTYDLSVRLGQGNGSFLAVQSYPLVIANQPVSVAVGDVTGDGKPDLVATGQDDMWVLEGRGDGTFGAPQRFAGGGTSLVLEDLDGNGTLEAVSIRNGVQVLPHL